MKQITIQYQKAELRRKVRNLINTKFNATQKVEKEINLHQQITSLPAWSKARTILLFSPLSHEPNLLTLLEKTSHRFFFPRMHHDELELFEWFSGAPWIKGAYNVQEPDPIRWQQRSLTEVDLALIPGLAFDAQGGRLGWGRGYFDRLLENSSFPTLKVGIAWSWQIVKKVPREEHDIKMDFVVTPEHCFVSKFEI